ncbi:MAG: hypothetical protein HFJ48_08040 [Clostridia bacterium]|jgi:hypothetical protein|nr:hypothetical protein [Clostridia bacterium]
MSKKVNNGTEEKIKTFIDLFGLFENCKGNDIELENSFNNDKYSIQIYSNGVEGNFIINNVPKLHIIFYTNELSVSVFPCKGYGVYDLKEGFTLMMRYEMKEINDLIDPNFLNVLTDYISKQ